MIVEGELKGAVLERVATDSEATAISGSIKYNKESGRPIVTDNSLLARGLAYADEVPSLGKINLIYHNEIAHGATYSMYIEFTQGVIDTINANSFSGNVYVTVLGQNGLRSGAGYFDGWDGSSTRIIANASGGGGGFAAVLKFKPEVGDVLYGSELIGTGSVSVMLQRGTNTFQLLSGGKAGDGTIKEGPAELLMQGAGGTSIGGRGGKVSVHKDVCVLEINGEDGGDGAVSTWTNTMVSVIGSTEISNEFPSRAVYQYIPPNADNSGPIIPVSGLVAGSGADVYPTAVGAGGATNFITRSQATPSAITPSYFCATYDSEVL